MHEKFLPNDIESPSAEVSVELPTDLIARQEFVKVMVVGSRQGIDIIIGLLHRLYFAEVREWTPPTPYGESGQEMSLMRKKVSLN